MVRKPCTECVKTHEIDPNIGPYVVRVCGTCGREMKVREPGKHGIGIKVNKGDRFVIPSGWMKISANPLKGNLNFTESGLNWFAKLIFLNDLPREVDGIDQILTANEKYATDVLNSSSILKGLDVEKDSDTAAIQEIIRNNDGSAEWYALAMGIFSSIIVSAIEEGDARKAAWATTFAERMRAMLVFKQNLEEAVWIGHSAGRKMISLLRLWDANRSNNDEGFWQTHLKENSYLLSQLFSVPVVFLQDNAYVGGMRIDRKDARLVDYLFTGDSSNEAILIEIKTPTTKLLGSKYRRNIYKPSSEISGSVVQILDYRHSLTQNLKSITSGLNRNIHAFNPHCVVIAGDGTQELTDSDKRHSFEIFRSSLQNVDVITYDELFQKLEILASLFNIKKSQQSA